MKCGHMNSQNGKIINKKLYLDVAMVIVQKAKIYTSYKQSEAVEKE